MFEIGETVVYVGPGKSCHADCPLDTGKIYRIAGFVPYKDSAGRSGILLEGLPSRHISGGWAHTVFRKLRKADESFTEMLRACKPSDRVEV